jgi:DNA polymerase elongation subunit (family B)
MYMLYENVFNVKSKTYERVYNPDTKKSEIREINLTPTVYIPGNGSLKYFLDKSISLTEKRFESAQDMNAWCKSMDEMNMPYFGKTTPKYQYIRDAYYFNNNQYVNNDHAMRIWYLDIEVSQEFGFPFPNEAKAPVTLIQIYDSFDDKYYIIGYKPIEGHEDPKNLERVKEYNAKYSFPEKTTYLQVNDEAEMFKYMFKLIKVKNPTIMTAWNGDLFDFPYIINRADKIGLNSNDLSPVQDVKCEYKKVGNSDVYNTTISGIYLLDLMELYKKFTFTPQTSFSLNNIASVELGAEKVEYSEYDNLDHLMVEDYVTFVRYGIVDVELILGIDKKLNLINLVKSIAYKMGICLDDALGTVKPWGTYITNIAYSEGFILPNDGGSRGSHDQIKGAWVADPEVGKHNWIVSFDWASLYPSIIRWCNFSPETYINTKDLPPELMHLKTNVFIDDEDLLINRVDELIEKVTPLLEKYNVSAGINGSFYRRDEVGLIPRLIKQLYAERKADKKQMFVHSQHIQTLKTSGATPEEIKAEEYLEAFWDTAQMTKKILLNSLYGALGNQYFVLFNNEIAAAITGNGRYTNKTMAFSVDGMLREKLPSKKPYLVYGDTDSFYLTVDNFVQAKRSKSELSFTETIDFCNNVCEKVVQPYVNIMTDKVGKSLNVLEADAMAMDREIIADSGIFIAKKRYIARVLDTEGVRLKEPKKKVMGLEIVRSSTPMFCRKYLKDSIDILLDGDESSLQTWTSDVKKKFMSAPIDEVSRVTGVNKVSFNFKIPDGKDSTTGAKKFKGLESVYPGADIKNIGFKVFNHSLFFDSPDGKAECSPIPINSRAAVVHNMSILVAGLQKEYNYINEKDKMKYLLLKTPNTVNSDVFGYMNSTIIDRAGLTKYIDRESMWDRFFIQALDIMIGPLGWSHQKKITVDEWC